MKKFPQKDILAIKDEIEKLGEDPYQDIEKIKDPNIPSQYRARRGNYRIFFDIDGSIIKIHYATLRKDAYR